MVLEAHLRELQAALAGSPKLRLEALDGKTQARLAAYRSGSVDEESRWPELRRWFIDTASGIDRALRRVPAVRHEWDA
jgi:hypothetical protein